MDGRGGVGVTVSDGTIVGVGQGHGTTMWLTGEWGQRNPEGLCWTKGVQG